MGKVTGETRYEGRANPNPLTPKEDDWTYRHHQSHLSSTQMDDKWLGEQFSIDFEFVSG